jgi:hypothetical protein
MYVYYPTSILSAVVVAVAVAVAVAVVVAIAVARLDCCTATKFAPVVCWRELDDDCGLPGVSLSVEQEGVEF